MTKQEVYELIIHQNGIEHQMAVCIEELSELTKELTKLLRTDAIGASTMHLAEEIADVRICLEQLEQYYQLKNKINYFKRFKIQRLEKFYIKISKEVKEFFEELSVIPQESFEKLLPSKETGVKEKDNEKK